MTIGFDTKDFFNLLSNGSSDGSALVLAKAITEFSRMVSDDFEDCYLHSVENNITIWDYYGLEPGNSEIPEVINELWIELLISRANQLDHKSES